MQGRSHYRMLAVAIAAVVVFLACQLSLAREPWPADFLDDADLHDIYFIDSEQGWAVGDRGAILHTIDGGATWNIQQTPIGDSLHGIHFIDAQNGWAVGGSAVPYTQRGRGVVLHTDNGGRTWLTKKVRTLPALRDVMFFDKKQGVAIGDASTLYPAGAFSTRDGGRTWNPYPIRTAHGWIAADFRSTGRGLLLAAAGHITTCDGANCRARSTPRVRDGRMRDIAWIDDERAIAVGDQGAVWLSQDGGARWSDVSRNIAATDAAAAKFDFLTAASDGTNLWVAGATGSSPSRLYRSADGGQSWQSISLQHSVPINKLTFDASSGRGWAVGPLGGILQSSNRHQSWRTVRGDNRRLFVLAAFDDAEEVPWTLLAQVAGGYGGRLRVIVANTNAPTALSMAASERLHQAALAVGASNAESIRTQDYSKVISRAIGDWNPSLVIIGGSDSFVKEANSAASSTEAPIAVWRTEMRSTAQTRSTVSVVDSEIAQSLSASLAQLNADARSIIGLHDINDDRVLSCTPLNGLTATGARITNGFSFRPGSPPRRAAFTPSDERHDSQQSAQQYTLLQQLIRRAVEDQGRGAAWLAQVENMTSRLSPGVAAKVLYKLAGKQLATGDVPSALATLDAIAMRHATSDIHDVALRDGVLWSASREAAHLGRAVAAKLADQTESRVRPAAYKFDPAAAPRIQEPVRRDESIPSERLFNTGQTIADQMEFAPTPAQQLLAEQAAFGKGNNRDSPIQNASHIGAKGSQPTKLSTWLERVGPEHLADPDLQLAIESHRRRVTKPGARQEAVFQRLARTLPGTWRDCANAELALIKPERGSIKPMVAGRFGARPRLDGKLTVEEATWPDFGHPSAKHPAIVVPLQTVDAVVADSSPAGVAMLAADREFLYIAIRCQQQPQSDYSYVKTPRTRDADLAHHDRVSILIDTDRDYSLAWRLTVDHRGWTGESLDTNSAWNPRWFVTATKPEAAQNGEWVCEAAIAWSELDEQLPTMNNPWALKVVRTLPDGQKQFWPESSGKTQHLEDAGLFYFAE